MNYPVGIVKTDFLIIGSGLSGLMAARAVAHADARTDITMLGCGAGASPMIHGFNMPLADDDSVELFKQDTEVSGRGQSNPELVDTLCEGSLELLPILDELDVHFDRKEDGSYSLLRPLGASVPRVASVGNHTGALIMSRIKAELAVREHTHILGKVRALRLLIKGGAVKGALCYDIRDNSYVFFAAKSVLLANGGFCRIYPFSTNSGDIGGDGIAMAYHAGLPLVDLEYIQFEPSAAVYPDALRGKSVITTMYYEGAVLRNKQGERFMQKLSDKAECVNKDVQAKAIFNEIKEGRGTSHGGVYFDATGVGKEKLDSLYPSYVKRYTDVGIDISKTPFEIAPAPHTSLGGVDIGGDCGTSVSGLFACGEIVGGIHGANRVGGNAGLETMVFGNRAGITAAAFLAGANTDYPTQTEIETFASPLFEGASEISESELAEKRKAMETVLSENVNVLRRGDELTAADGKLTAVYERLRDGVCRCASPLATYNKLRLQNDVLTALLLTKAANARGESSGCHVRTDCDTEAKDKYTIKITKCESGVKLDKCPLANK